MYLKGLKKLDYEMDIVKIIKDLRILKIYIEKTLMTPEIKFQIEHSSENLLNMHDDSCCNK